MIESEKDAGDKENSETQPTNNNNEGIKSKIISSRGPATRNRIRNSERKLAKKLANSSRNQKRSSNEKERSSSMLDSAYVCFVCHQRSPDVCALETHMLKHNLYLCPTCERCFKYKRSYQNHRFICQDGAPKPTRFYPQGVKRPRKSQDMEDDSPRRGSRRTKDTSRQQPFHLSYDSESAEPSPSELYSPKAGTSGDTNRYKECEEFQRVEEVVSPSTTKINEEHRIRKTSDHKQSSEEAIVSCDLRTLALAAASVSPHSKAVIDLVNNDHLAITSKINQNALTASSSYIRSFAPQFMLPSAFMPPNGNPREPLFLWQGIEIQSESPIISRLEGFNPITEQHYLLYKCCLCSQIFPGMSLLASHIATHAKGSKDHYCEKCGAFFKWRSQLEVHEQVHMVMDNMALTNHSPLLVNRLLNPGSFEESTHRELQLFGQPVLPPNTLYPIHQTSFTPASEHARKESNKGSSSSDDAPPTSEKPLPKINGYSCNFCPKSFDRLFSLQRHERIHTGVKICFCKQCGRGFSERRNLRHHVIRFHSDINQRDLFRKSMSKPKGRKSNSSHKLVSFLKKTAVRILNTMEQSKYNPTDKLPSPDAISYVLPKTNLQIDQRLEHKKHRNSSSPPMIPNIILEKATTNPTSPRMLPNPISEQSEVIKTTTNGEEHHEKYNGVTVVFPTDVSIDPKTPVEPNKILTEDDQKEVLIDPKRSLIGSRRKGKPIRYAPNQTNSNEVLDLTPSESVLPSKTNNSIPQVKEEMDSATEDNNTYDLVNASYSGTENSEDAFPSNVSQHVSPHFKARLRGHGSFFSNYNPRLGVVNRPVARSQACRPQVGSDGRYVYPCTYCFKTFCSTSDLNRHMDFHEDVRPFKCPYCSYFSRTNSQLKVHMMRHQGIKQYLCTLCNYNGVTQSDLNRHCKTRSHVMRDRNSCTACGIGFYTRTLLEEHLRIVDHDSDVSVLPIDCVAASYGFIKKEDDEIEESDLAEVRVIEETKDNDELSNEANNNDYRFNSKYTNKLANGFQKKYGN